MNHADSLPECATRDSTAFIVLTEFDPTVATPGRRGAGIAEKFSEKKFQKEFPASLGVPASRR
jgi:hypothetical protein